MESFAELYYKSTDFSGFFSPSDDIKKYYKNSDKCLREVLMEHFDTFGNIQKLIKIHSCCSVCAKTCKCEECDFVTAAAAMDETRVNDVHSENETALSSREKELLVTKLREYRKTVCPEDQYGLLFGIEIATGIPDYVIENILNNAHQCSMDYLLQCGLSYRHSLAINDMVGEILRT